MIDEFNRKPNKVVAHKKVLRIQRIRWTSYKFNLHVHYMEFGRSNSVARAKVCRSHLPGSNHQAS